MAKRKVISKEELKTVGEIIFSKKGYFLTKISDIVAEAGVSQGTFYLNYDSKKALFLDLLKDFREGLENLLNHQDLKTMNPETALIESQKRLFCYLMENKTKTFLIYREGYAEKEFALILEDIHRILTETRSLMLKNIFKEKLSEEQRESMSYMIGGIIRSLFMYYEGKNPEKEIYSEKIQNVLTVLLKCLESETNK